MANIHEHHRGLGVRALATSHRRFPADFPGWGRPGAAESLLPIPQGLPGVIADVESHGSNPWTRYSVRFADGTRACGLVLGDDIELTR
jgi:hypothetical protein